MSTLISQRAANTDIGKPRVLRVVYVVPVVCGQNAQVNFLPAGGNVNEVDPSALP